jgi:site-specific DNA-methyltransferase (adenine-specific)
MKKVIIGDCTLYQGDCREITQTGAHVLVSDPPYDITARGGGIGAKRQYLKGIQEKGLESGFDVEMLRSFKRWAVFCTKRQLCALIGAAENEVLNWALLTWNKPNPTPLTNNNYLPDTEYIIHAFDAGGIYGGYMDKARFFVHNAGGGEYNHPTVKPLAVMKKILKTASDVGQTVFDPFMGTGTTGVACVQMGRKFVGAEIVPEYFDIACKRIEEAYKQPDMFIHAAECVKQDVLL